MKKILSLSFGLLAIVSLSGCNKSDATLSNGKELETKGKCVATECIKQMKVENTVDEINDIIGVKGELADSKYNTYYWELSEDSGIEVTYYSGSKGNIEVIVDRSILANNKVDFSKYEDLRTKVNEGITYSEFITYIGNVEGTLIAKDSSSNEYIWVDGNDSYLKATFSNTSNECKFASGMIK